MSALGREGPLDPPNSIGKAMQGLDLDGHQLPPSPAPSSPRNGRKYALATELVFTEGTDQYGASSVPIYQVHISTFLLSNIQSHRASGLSLNRL